MVALLIAGLGCVTLVGLAVLIAQRLDDDAQRSAWDRIAAGRRALAEDVEEVRRALDSLRRCPRCGARIWPPDADDDPTRW